MGGPQEGPDRPGSTPPWDPDAEGADYLDIREEWGPEATRPGAAGTGRDRAERANERRPADGRAADARSASSSEKVSPRRVRGIARSVELRPLENGVETLVFRVDRYDAAGNRLTPIGVEMQGRRRGRITDGDEVEVAGRWSRGTLQADRITNLTTASEVVGFPRWLKWVGCGIFLLFIGGIFAIGVFAVLSGLSQISGTVPNVEGMEEVVVASGPSGSGQATTGPGSAPNASAADERVAIPAVLGLDAESATAAVAAAGLSASTGTEASDVVPEGLAIRSEPGAGTMLVPGDQVLVVVSSGPVPAPNPTPAPDVVVPPVAGHDEATANQTLTDAGFLVVVVYEGFCFGEHTAIRTEPTEGTVLPAGSTITLVSTC